MPEYRVLVTFRTPAGALDSRPMELEAADAEQAMERAAKRVLRAQDGREIIGVEIED